MQNINWILSMNAADAAAIMKAEYEKVVAEVGGDWFDVDDVDKIPQVFGQTARWAAVANGPVAWLVTQSILGQAEQAGLRERLEAFVWEIWGDRARPQEGYAGQETLRPKEYALAAILDGTESRYDVAA